MRCSMVLPDSAARTVAGGEGGVKRPEGFAQKVEAKEKKNIKYS